MKIFVTGATGFIGSHFIRSALESGHEIVALRFPGTKPVIPIPSSSQVNWIEGDLNSFLRPDAAYLPSGQKSGEACALLHFAAYGVSPQPCTWEQAFQINVMDSILLLNRACDAGIQRMVLCGSCVEFGRSAERYEFIPADAPLEPVGHYAASKAALSLAATALCHERKFELAILRLFTVFGEGQYYSNLWPSLKVAASEGKDFEISPGQQIRDFIPVELVAKAFLRALELPRTAFYNMDGNADANYRKPNPVLANIGTGMPQTVLSFAAHWWRHFEAKGKILPGALPYRNDEIMRYVPEISPLFSKE